MGIIKSFPNIISSPPSLIESRENRGKYMKKYKLSNKKVRRKRFGFGGGERGEEIFQAQWEIPTKARTQQSFSSEINQM
jgi:hypothetical protein